MLTFEVQVNNETPTTAGAENAAVLAMRVLHFVEGSKPIQVERVDPAEDEKQLRDYYETLKKRFEPTNLD